MYTQRTKRVMMFATAVLASFAITTTSNAATLSSTTTAPTPDGADIFNLVTPQTTGDILNGDRPAAGQTFLTLGNSAGYTLSALTMYQTRTVTTTGGTWNLRLGTVSGTTFTPVATDTLTIGNNALSLSGNGDDFITYTLTTPLELDPNTLYGIDLVRTGGGNFVNWGENANTNYGGGQAYTSPPNGSGGPTLSLSNNDRIFLVDLVENTTAPEPSTLILAVLGLVGLAGTRRRRQR